VSALKERRERPQAAATVRTAANRSDHHYRYPAVLRMVEGAGDPTATLDDIIRLGAEVIPRCGGQSPDRPAEPMDSAPAGMQPAEIQRERPSTARGPHRR
jgi:hypothetical protein